MCRGITTTILLPHTLPQPFNPLYSSNPVTLIFWCSSLWAVSQVIMFEEQEADYKVHFEDVPDLGMAVDIQ